MIYSPELPWAVSLVAPPSTLQGNALLIRRTNTHLGWDLQFSTGFIKGPKRDSGWLMELKSTAIFGGIINLPLAGTCCEGLGKIPTQLLGSCSMSIAINRLIDSLNLMPIEPHSPDWVSTKALPTHVPEEGRALQAVLLVDRSLPGVWRNIIMFLALGHTGLRPSIKLRSNWKKRKREGPNSTITSALLPQEARQEKRE